MSADPMVFPTVMAARLLWEENAWYSHNGDSDEKQSPEDMQIFSELAVNQRTSCAMRFGIFVWKKEKETNRCYT